MSNSVKDIKVNMFVRVNPIFVAVLLSKNNNPFILKPIETKYVNWRSALANMILLFSNLIQSYL